MSEIESAYSKLCIQVYTLQLIVVKSHRHNPFLFFQELHVSLIFFSDTFESHLKSRIKFCENVWVDTTNFFWIVKDKEKFWENAIGTYLFIIY